MGDTENEGGPKAALITNGRRRVEERYDARLTRLDPVYDELLGTSRSL